VNALVLLVIISIITALSGLFMSGQLAAALTPYDSGYRHGCADGRLGGHFYLDTPGKGPTFHTAAFMQGYNNGYSACVGATNTNSYQHGYNQGYQKAVSSYAGDLNTNFNDSCPPSHSADFCNGYVHGYDAGWQFENSDQ
jgi:hypothetical protein